MFNYKIKGKMRLRKVTVLQIIDVLTKDIIAVLGPREGYIDNLADVEHTNPCTLDWIDYKKKKKQILAENSLAKVILVDTSVIYTEAIKSASKTLIVVRDPKMALATIGNHFFTDVFPTYIHPTAVIDPEAELAGNVTIEPFAFIGKAKIGRGTVISANVRIYDNVEIGEGCYIKEGAVIGGMGFGFEKDKDGNYFRFPQIGGVKIGNFVEIGANTCIDRGALSDTIIGDYTKIDNLCQIAHNNHIGKNVVITACSGIAGSCNIGDGVWIGPNSMMNNWLKVGNQALVGIGSTVIRDIPDNEVWFGNPAEMIDVRK